MPMPLLVAPSRLVWLTCRPSSRRVANVSSVRATDVDAPCNFATCNLSFSRSPAAKIAICKFRGYSCNCS